LFSRTKVKNNKDVGKENIPGATGSHQQTFGASTYYNAASNSLKKACYRTVCADRINDKSHFLIATVLHLAAFPTFACWKYMWKSALHTCTALVIALLLLLNGTSHDFLHSFTGHEDTTDCAHRAEQGGYAFEQQHHHCDLLDLPSPVFITTTVFALPLVYQQYQQRYQVWQQAEPTCTLLANSGRGPPAFSENL
jgi:hypothetical protein